MIVILKKIKNYIFLIAPLIVVAVFCVVAKLNNIYPFGNKSIGWCDMNQQFIPLLCDFKDILNGKNSLFLSMENAGGINFYGIYMFFLSSPFSYLVAFVDKSNMSLFVNILVMLKMAAAGFTSAIYFRKSIKGLNQTVIIALSVLYSFSGYIMLYYQDAMWLDMVYLFPLLMLALERLVRNNNFLWYSVILAWNVITCFYISYMIVVFVILYIGVHLIYNDENRKKTAVNFIVGSLIACLMVAVIYIPVLIQYSESARTASTIKTLSNSTMVSSIYTTVPTILCLAFFCPFLFIKSKNKHVSALKILLVLTVIPIFIEPVNKMWQTGNYMSFPTRYGFIIIFTALIIVGNNISDQLESNKKTLRLNILRLCAVVVSVVFIFFVWNFTRNYLTKNIEVLSKYTRSLWGNSDSFEKLVKFYAIIFFTGAFLYLLFRLKLLKKFILGIFLIALTLNEAYFSMNVYMVSPSHSVSSFQSIMQLQDAINDDGFYRVKTSYKLTDVNTIGALGYNNLGHYTSLNSEDYLYTMKKLGYSSYWMEVGAYGGTVFTDALLNNKYTIRSGKNSSALYSFENYNIVENKYFMPLGLVVDKDLSNCEALSGKERWELQNNLSETLFGENNGLYTKYSYDKVFNINDMSNDACYNFKTVSTYNYINYNIAVNGTKTLYFDAFDNYSNSLTEHINDSFAVYVNGKIVTSDYPTKAFNGEVDLGTFTDTTVNVEIKILKDVYCKSFGVFGVDNTVLDNIIGDAEFAQNFNCNKNSINGECFAAEENEYLFLSIPYNKGYKLKINGKSGQIYKVCSDFIAVKLNKGENEISLKYIPQGFKLGTIISLAGLIIFCFFVAFKKKIVYNKLIEGVCLVGTWILFGIVITAVYIAPIIINLIGSA